MNTGPRARDGVVEGWRQFVFSVFLFPQEVDFGGLWGRSGGWN